MPCPISIEFVKPSLTYSFAKKKASLILYPFPIKEANEDEKLHPVP